MYFIKKVSRAFTMILAPLALVACGGSGGSGSGSESKKEENLSLTKDTAFVYVARDTEQVQQSISAAKLNKSSQNTSVLTLGSPYDFNPGAKLISRSSLDTNGLDTDLLTQYFGSSDFDVKDINISADGKKAVFAAHGPKNHPRDYTWNIYEYSFSDGSIRRVIASDFIANAGEDTNPTYALDGTIIFSSNRAAGNPNSPVDNIVDPDQEANCRKIDAGHNVSLLHSMTPEGKDIVQLTYGKNHDIKPTTLKDGRIAFIRWTHTENLVEGCPVSSDLSTKSSKTEYPVGLSAPQKWSQDKLCSLATETEQGFVLPSNNYTLLTITPDGKDMDQLYKTVTLAGSDEGFIEVDQIVQAENGHLIALLKHHFNSIAGGDIVELQSPERTFDRQIFGNIAPSSLVGDIALYPEQQSVEGWYSSFWPYRDGSGRLLVSWSQCATTKNGVSQLCQSASGEEEVDPRYGIWVFDKKTESRLPIVQAKKNVIYSNLAVAQPHVGVDFPFAPYNPNFVDNLDANRVVCTYSSSSSSYSSYSSYASYSSNSYSSSVSYSSSSSSYIYVPVSSAASSVNSYTSSTQSSANTSSYPSVNSSAYSSVASSTSSLNSTPSSTSSIASVSSVSSAPSSESSVSSALSSTPSSVSSISSSLSSTSSSESLSSVSSISSSLSSTSSSESLSSVSSVSSSLSSTSSSVSSVSSSLSSSSRSSISSVSSTSSLSSASSSSSNTAPVADAGDDQTVEVGAVALVDGSGSSDKDGDVLTYEWSIISQPTGSSPVLTTDPQSPLAQVEVDLAGEYRLQLIVNDGHLNSAPAMVVVTVEEPAPVCKMDGATTRSFPVIIRDFDESHPDFEQNRFEEDYGIVAKDLGADGLPVYALTSGKTRTTNGRDYFDQWYRDVDGINIKFHRTLEMTRSSSTSSVWTYANNAFFPIDGLGFGNMPGYNHNFHFTLETHLVFDYNGGEEFTFSGDDDLWVFINGKRAIDIGGIHKTLKRTIKLDDIAGELGIEKGKRYTFDLFFAERQTSESNFSFQTSIQFECVPESK